MEQYIPKSAIVAEIERRRNICKKVVLDLRTKENQDYYQGKAEAYKEVLNLLNTLEVKYLQEEPVSKVWHDASEEPKPNMELICVGQYGNPLVLSSNSDSFKSRDISKWAYFNDLLNLSNVQRTVKNWKEPVGEDLEKAAYNYSVTHYPDYERRTVAINAFKAGAEWQKEHLWKPADGDDLPEYEQEVVVFTQDFSDDAGMMMVAIGHRPTPEGFDGRSLTTGKVEHYTPKTYDKGGWNIPNVVLWLDLDIPQL